MQKYLNFYLLFSILIMASYSWPSYANDKRFKGDKLNTAMVHNDCCPIYNTFKSLKSNKANPDVTYAPLFTHQWNMWEFDNCYGNPECPQPPYSPLPPVNASRGTRGKTYYNLNYRGGSQKQQYYDKCIPIFPDSDTQFPCDFYLIKEENKAFMTTKGAPAQFGQCCILAEDFHPPEPDFTKNMLYGGVKVYEGKQYYEYNVMIPESGGPFVHGFWTKPTQDKNIVPAFFYMVGMENKWLYQSFDNYSIFPFDTEKVFKIPDSCRSQNVGFCPGFETVKGKKKYASQ